MTGQYEFVVHFTMMPRDARLLSCCFLVSHSMSSHVTDSLAVSCLLPDLFFVHQGLHECLTRLKGGI